METILLGRSELAISRMAYGCWRIVAANEGADGSIERARKSVGAAVDAGFRLFDLADIYSGGEAERAFGKILADDPSLRARIVVATKCGIRKQGDPTPTSPYRYDFSAGHIVWSCEQSLQRLGLDCVDLYLLHRPDYLCQPDEVAGAFARLLQAGKVRCFGVSNFRPSQVTMLQRACPMPLVTNQVEVSLLRLESFHDGTMDECLLERRTPLAWSPLGGGRLAVPDPIDLRDPDHARRIRVREAQDWIAREHGVSRAVLALAWLLRHPARIVPIVGSTEPARIRELARAVDIELSREEWYQLLEASVNQRLP